MKYLIPIVIQIAALVVGLAEALIPSFGILTVFSLALLGYSWYFILQNLSPTAIWVFGIANVILIPITIKMAFNLFSRSKISHRTDLGVGSGLEDEDIELNRLQGLTATVETPMRPVGKIRVLEEIYEASSSGEFLMPGEEVIIVSAAGTRIRVEKPPQTKITGADGATQQG